MKIRQRPDANSLSARQLAADYKEQGLDKYRAWDQFIIERGLKPEIDVKEFYKVFNAVQPEALTRTVEMSISPNCIDTLCNRLVNAQLKSDGVWEMIWDDGCRGTFPPCDPPDPERFISIFRAARPVQMRLF